MSDDPAVWQKTVTVSDTERDKIKLYTPDGRVMVVNRNEVGFKPAKEKKDK